MKNSHASLAFIAGWLTLLCSATGATPPLAPTEGREEIDKIIVAVSDNSSASALNIRRLFEVVTYPDVDPELFELLGRPAAVRLVFGENFRIDEENMTESYIATARLAQTYAALYFEDAGTPLVEVQERLRADDRFVYAAISEPWHFSATPNDPFFADPFPFTPENVDFQWGSQTNSLGLPAAWDRNTGWAQVGLLDGGPPITSDPSGNLFYLVSHPDLLQVVAYNLSANFQYGYPAIANPRQLYVSQATPHGTHTMGIIAANSNNGVGVAGVCWHCSIFYGQVVPDGGREPDTYSVSMALTSFANWGAQVVNLSAGINPQFFDDCTVTGYGTGADPTCIAMVISESFGTMFIASGGNNKDSAVDFPARDAKAIGVGGTDVLNATWDEQNWPADAWDYTSGPYVGCPNYPFPSVPPNQCGSNQSAPGLNQLDFAAPARLVVSTIPLGAQYDPINWSNCNDYNFPGPYTLGPAPYYEPRGQIDSYGYCTGTSMSAPFITGIAALVRSVNPLLDSPEVYKALKSGASGNGIYSSDQGWGRPNAGLAVSNALGKVNGVIVINRLTPMFVLRNYTEKDRLYTTRPQAASGALSGNYLTDVYRCVGTTFPCTFAADPGTYIPRPYASAPSAPNPEATSLIGYDNYPTFKPTSEAEPRASFWVFTSDKSPWPSIALKPLYRLSFREPCDWRDHIYTTEQAGINYLTTTDFCPQDAGFQSYHLDGIEGYILNGCPPQYNCDSNLDSTAPQKLYRRYSYSDESYALLLDSQLGVPPFFSYATDPFYNPATGGVIGYVFPNIDSDSDGLPDGMERMYGMNWLSGDSDGDGYSDLIEFPLTTLQLAKRDPLIP